MFEGRRVIVDHDYAPEVMKRRKEYIEAKKTLREKKIRFQTPFPAKLRVFYEGETRVYNTATEATKDMAERGFQVKVIKPATDLSEKIQRLMWHRAETRDKPEGTTMLGYKQRLQAFRRTSDNEQ